MVSPLDIAQPTQCIPISWKAGIASGNIPITSPMRVSFVISMFFLRKRKIGANDRPNQLICKSGLLLSHLGKALAAVYGAVCLGLEGNPCLFSAVCTNSREILSGSAGSILASISASFATLGLILESALCVELLLTCSKNELFTAFFAN
jgi:hypothetical protein